MSELTLLEAIIGHGTNRPEAPALLCDDETVTWRALLTEIRLAAATLTALGAREGERVAILSANSPQAVIAYLGAVAAGACAVPLPVSLNDDGLAGLITDCAPCVIAADQAGIARCSDIGWPAARLLPLAAYGDVQATAGFPANPPGTAPFNIIYSSGTTGTPKGIVHSHAMRNGQSRRTAFALGPDSRMLLSTPLYSNTTLVPMLATLFHGGTTRLMRKFDTRGYLALVESWRATHTMLVPVQYRRLMDHPEFDRFDLTSMQVKQSTSAYFEPDLQAEVQSRFPGVLYQVYGLTEGGISTRLDVSAHPDKLDTVGQPTPGVELRIIDGEGRELLKGEIGEIVGRSPYMMSGYYGRKDLSDAMIWTSPDGGRFFRSGDLGRFDDDDFLVIVGRKKEMINSGGFNVYPVDLEAALTAHPDVAEAAVFAIPSRAWGETPYAAVVLRDGARAAAAEILAFANSRLGRMQRIDGLDLRAELPRSSIGKVAKPQLAREYRDRSTT